MVTVVTVICDHIHNSSQEEVREVVAALRRLFEMHPETREQSPEQLPADLYIWTDLGYEPAASLVSEALKAVKT